MKDAAGIGAGLKRRFEAVAGRAGMSPAALYRQSILSTVELYEDEQKVTPRWSKRRPAQK
jgi:hypothetical protein